jgi:hypothetical protein
MFSYFTKEKEQKALYYQLKNEIEKSIYYDLSGWYIIYKDKICLYVGQSKNIPSRITTHLNGKYSNCDTILIYFNYEDGYDRLDITEKYLMNIFKPIENVLVDFSKEIKDSDIAESDILYALENFYKEDKSNKDLIIDNASLIIKNYEQDILVYSDMYRDFYENSKLTKMFSYMLEGL